MRGLAIDTIAMVIITAAVIVIGIGIVESFGGDIRNALPYKIAEGVSKSIPNLFLKGGFNVCESMHGQRISYQDFLSLLTAMRSAQCNSTSVTINFALTQEDLASLSGQVGTGNVIYGISEPLGAGFLLVKPNPGYYPFTLGDIVDIASAGAPERDLILQVTLKGCDPNDNVCDISCTFEDDYGMADPVCYSPTEDGKGVCDFKSVDVSRDGKIDTNDLDGICDPDCYNNRTNYRNAFDPDCTQPSVNPAAANDGICDPDSHGVDDGVCDNDCQSGAICDPNCAGNPLCICGSNDPANPKGIDGYCSPACRNEPDFPNTDKDWDCRVEFGNTWVEGDGKCSSDKVNADGEREHCGNSRDCPAPGVACAEKYGSSEPRVCAPKDTRSNPDGCAPAEQGEGETCAVREQCKTGLLCAGGHCCPAGNIWNGTACMKAEILDWVFIPIGIPAGKESVYFEQADKAFQWFLKDSPIGECSDPSLVAKKYVIEPSVCSNLKCQCHSYAPSIGCSGIDCIVEGKKCLKQAGLDGKACKAGETCLDKVYDIYAVITATGGWTGGSAGSIPSVGTSSSLGSISTVVHEQGHSFGLYHNSDKGPGCGAPGGSGSGPNAPDNNKGPRHMTYCPSRDKYGEWSYYYMKYGKDKNERVWYGGFRSLSKYLEACK